ncbi:MAG: glycerophosphoryl diester phosphodiesterase membrane domain-containing protein [Ruminococcus sp.]|nr:glycerophosphoryl diester phosphodiesterase membrane domain-containing protein [Ruminococcus sp.]
MKKQRLLPYRQSVPSILLLFQIISSLALQIRMSCFSVISRLLIRSTGHSVIWSNPLFSIGAVILIAALFLVGVLFIFILHGTLIDGMPLRNSGGNSLNLIRKNKKKFFPEMLRFFLVLLAVFAAAFVITAIITFLSLFLQIPENVLIPITVFSLSLISCVMLIFVFMTMPLLMLKLTSLYLDFKSEGEWRYEKRENRKSPVVIVTAGLDVAYKMGASGGEIDIQRTSDGSCIVLHDNTFSRVAGVDKKPSEMTLEEVKQLRVDGEPVPTLEDMLDASHGRLTLYVELKGETYVESTYPEMNTGFILTERRFWFGQSTMMRISRSLYKAEPMS